LDTGRCYDTECYPFMKVLYDRLLDYDTSKGAGNDLIPEAAVAMPTLSNGGRTYIFKLRNDVHFWNGRLATSADWVYSFERIIDPKTQAGAASFWFGIVGANDFKNGKAKHVSGIKALGQFGLEIDLVDPDPTFLNVLAMPFGSVVDRNQIAKYGKSYATQHPMGTGPYVFSQHILGQKMILTKNPHYFNPSVGHVAAIEADFGVTTDVSLLRVEKGQADMDGDFPNPLPQAEFLNVLNDPVLGKRIVKQQQVATEYIAMNVQVKPFDNLKVRQAVEMAINKPLLARLVNGRGTPTDTFIPPLMPGYGKFSLYSNNIDAAKKLLADAGFPNGFSTTFYSDDTTDDPRISQAIVQQLAQIGINAQLKVLNANTMFTLWGTKGKVPISWAGWYQDFPDPNDFFEPILSCASAVPGTFNEPWYCNPKVDVFAHSLKIMTDRAARLAKYVQLDKMMMQDAPVVPVLNPVFFSLPSAALHNYYLRSPWTNDFAYISKS